ncbi:MAG: hypothetical protein WCX79_01880 [Candidatus Paceibacterota bacterium]|jgi:uncharacterized protein with PIN domain
MEGLVKAGSEVEAKEGEKRCPFCGEPITKDSGKYSKNSEGGFMEMVYKCNKCKESSIINRISIGGNNKKR